MSVYINILHAAANHHASRDPSLNRMSSAHFAERAFAQRPSKLEMAHCLHFFAATDIHGIASAGSTGTAQAYVCGQCVLINIHIKCLTCVSCTQHMTYTLICVFHTHDMFVRHAVADGMRVAATFVQDIQEAKDRSIENVDVPCTHMIGISRRMHHKDVSSCLHAYMPAYMHVACVREGSRPGQAHRSRSRRSPQACSASYASSRTSRGV